MRIETVEFFRRRKLKKIAVNLLGSAKVLLNMRRDILPSETSAELKERSALLSASVKKRDYENMPALSEALSDTIRANTPVRFSPWLCEMTETLVVAFGVAMAFRAYFFQPFKIPTGSMQPTLYGIHSVQADPEDTTVWDRNPLKFIKLAVTGIRFVDITASKNGRVAVYSDNARHPGYAMLNVCGKICKIPSDAFERGEVNLNKDAKSVGHPCGAHVYEVRPTPDFVKKGTRIWSGYVIAGDQIFANRFKWNISRPHRDQIMVFKTSISKLEWGKSSPATRPFPFSVIDECYSEKLAPEQHYIKRLVGLPYESVSIADGRVVINGLPVSGFRGMDRISGALSGKTRGTSYSRYMTVSESNPEYLWSAVPPVIGKPGDTVELGDEYFPLGDNTSSSYDGRFWGPVPRKAMVAPASFVWWPFSCRWGFVN